MRITTTETVKQGDSEMVNSTAIEVTPTDFSFAWERERDLKTLGALTHASISAAGFGKALDELGKSAFALADFAGKMIAEESAKLAEEAEAAPVSVAVEADSPETPGVGYRFLKPGEMVLPTDQQWGIMDHKYQPVTFSGMAAIPGIIYRRKVEPSPEPKEPALPDPGPDHERIKGDGVWLRQEGDDFLSLEKKWLDCPQCLIGKASESGVWYRRRKPVAPTPETEIAANWAKIAGAQLPEGFFGTIDNGVRGGEGYVAVAHMGAFMQLAMLHALIAAIHRQCRDIEIDLIQNRGGESIVQVTMFAAEPSFEFTHDDQQQQILAMQKAVIFALESAAWLERERGGDGK